MHRLFASSVLVLAIANAALADSPAITGDADDVRVRLAARREAARLRVDRAMRELEESLQELRFVEQLAERVAGAKHRPAVSDAASIDSLPKEIRKQIQKTALKKVFVERADIDASVAVSFTGKSGDVIVAAGDSVINSHSCPDATSIVHIARRLGPRPTPTCRRHCFCTGRDATSLST